MLTLRLALKNMWRNPNRTAITMTAILFAVLLSILTSSLKTGIFDHLILNLVSYYSGYIQVHRRGYWEEQILENSFNSSKTFEARILVDQKIKALSPRLESFALASSGEHTKGCLVVGIVPESENQITSLKSRVIKGDYLNTSELSVMVSEGLLQRLQAKLNDTIVLLSQGYHGSTAAGKYKIGAILKFGSPELNEQTLFLTLPNAQELFAAPEIITSYVLSLNNLRDLNNVRHSIEKSISTDLEVMTWKEMLPDVEQHIRGDSNNMQIVHLVLYLLICFGIFSTLIMMMAERKFELGMLVAIGMSKFRLASMLLAESVLTVLAGCLLGILTAIPILAYLDKHPIRISGKAASAYQEFGFEPIFPVSLSPSHFIEQGIIVLILGLALSAFPVIQVFRINPCMAMRK